MTTSGRPTSSMPRTNAAMLMTGAILPIHQRRFADVKTELLKHVDIGCLAKDADTPPPEDFWRTKTWYAVRLGLHAPRRPSGLGAKARLEADAGTEASVSCINAPRISPTRNQARLFRARA